MSLSYSEKFINNIEENLKNNNYFLKTDTDEDGCINLSNYDICHYEEKVRSFLDSFSEVSDITICPKCPLFDLTFVDSGEGTKLTIKRVKVFTIGQFYSSASYYKYKKIYLDKDKDDIFLFDNSKKKGHGSVRSLTYKDLTQQVFNFIDDPVFFEIIYSFLHAVAIDENRHFLSDIRNELFDKSLVIPVKLSGLSSKHYYNKKMFLELEYKYNPINRVNKEPLSKSVLIQKAEPYIAKNQLQKFWSINVEDINFYDIDYRKGKDIAKTLYANLILNRIKNCDKLASIYDDEEIVELIEDYFSSSFTLGIKDGLDYNISSMKTLIKRHDNLVRLLAQMDFKKQQAKHKYVLKEPTNSPFKKLNFPDNYKKITSAEELYEEGVVQHHCVFSYLDKINSGKCVIYTCVQDDKRYTIEVVYENNEFVLKQLRGSCNNDPPKKVFLEISNLIKRENKKLKK